MKEKKYLKIFILAAAILLVVKFMFDYDTLTGFFSAIIKIINPFIFGFIIAYCINIPVTWFEKKLEKSTFKWVKRGARPISIVVNLLVLSAFIVFGLINFIPMIFNNASQLIAEMPGYLNTGVNELQKLPFITELGLDETLASLNILDIWNSLKPDSGSGITGVASSLLSGVFTVFLTIVATLYFLAEYNRVKDYIKRVIRAHSPKRQRPALKYIRLVDSSFRKFLTCQFLDALIIGTITIIEFTIMQSQYAVTLGLMIGVLNIIPYFGAIFGAVLAVFVIWATSGLKPAIIVAIMLLITQQIDGNFINPKIMGNSFKISPVLVIIAITIGGAVAGIMGMLFSIPIVNVIKTILEEYIQTKEKQREASKDSDVAVIKLGGEGT